MNGVDHNITGLIKRIYSSFDSSILQGASIAFITKVLGAGASFGLQILLARLLSLKDYGSYTYVMAWVVILSGLANIGFSTSLIRFIPEYIKKGEFGKLKGVLKTSLSITLLCSLLFAIIGLLIILFIPGVSVKSGNISAIYGYGLLLIPVLALMRLIASIEKGKKRMFMAFGPSRLFKPLLIALLLIIGWVITTQFNAKLALIFTLIAIAIVVGFQLLELKKGIPANYFQHKAIYDVKKWIKISFPLLMASGFLMILNRTDVIMLGIFSSKEQVGIYNVAFRVSSLVTFVLLAVNGIAAPTISELFHQHKLEELRRFARKIAHLIFWPTMVISVGLIIGAGFILSLFGHEFVSARILLIILLIGQLINASVGSVGTYLSMTGNQKDIARVFGIAALVNILFNPLGIYFYGAVGAAIVTTLTTAIWNIWLYFLVKRKLGIKSIVY